MSFKFRTPVKALVLIGGFSTITQVSQADGYTSYYRSPNSNDVAFWRYYGLNINDSGQITGDYLSYSLSGNYRCFVYSDSLFATIKDTTFSIITPSDYEGVCGPINNNGQVVGNIRSFNDTVHSMTGSYTTGFIYSDNKFTTLYYPNPDKNSEYRFLSTQINGINNDGQIIGSISINNSLKNFIYKNGAYNFIEMNGYTPIHINDKGQVLGSNWDYGSQSSNGILYDGSKYITITYPNSYGTNVTGINNNGQVVGYYVDYIGHQHGFLYDHGVYTTVDYPGDYNTRLVDINDSGQIAGNCNSYISTPNMFNGFIYDGNTYTGCKEGIPGVIYDINNNGEVVGVLDSGGLFFSIPNRTQYTVASPKNLGANCNCDQPNAPAFKEANPINPATGNKFQIETDFVGANIGLELTRFYNSQDKTAWALGANWRSVWLQMGTLTDNTTAKMTRADGRVDTFKKNASGVWVPDPDATSTLSVAMNGKTQIGWKLVTADDRTEFYRLDGRLGSITDRAGNVSTLSYDASNRLSKVTGPFGHTLIFTYDSSNRMASVTLPDGGLIIYGYDANNNLISVTYPDKTVRQYVYNEQTNTANTNLPHALTGIIDEAGNRYATYQYDAQGRAVSTAHAGGAEKVNIAYSADGSTSSVTDPLGNTHGYKFTTQFDLVKPTKVTGVPVSNVSGQAFTYDANGFVASRTDWNGNTTIYTHDTRGQELSRTEASGTAQARTITTTWHPTFHLPTQITEPSGVSGINRVTTLSYDSLQGTLLQKTVTAGKLSRTWKYTYNKAGQKTSITDPNGNVTTFTYDPKGGLASVSNALGQITAYANDANGRPVTITDPNSLVTKITYTPRGQVASKIVGQQVTKFSYTKNNQLQSIIQPDGSSLNYTYNTAHQLTRVTDALGNYIDYTLDLAGNVTVENVYDKNKTLRRSLAHTYDAVNRLTQNSGAYANETTTYERDANGNVTGVTDPNKFKTQNGFDALNRLAMRIDPNNGKTVIAYNPDDSVASVTDARSVKTSYTYNALGDQIAVISPDTGTTMRTFDAAGNITTSTDARGQKTTYRYDKLNRLIAKVFADNSSVFFTYDQGVNGIGRLTTMTDSSGTTTWTFDQYGHNLQKTQKIGSATLTTVNTYNMVTGQLLSTTLPSKSVITYSYDLNGKLLSITNGKTPIVSQIIYDPFGLPSDWVQGAGGALHHYRTTDLDGRVSDILFENTKAPASQEHITLTRDSGGRITQVTNNTVASQFFSYDAMDEVTSYSTGANPVQNYVYDPNGNRTMLSSTTNTVNYTIDGASNRLLSSNVGKAVTNYTLDAAGNLTSDVRRSFATDASGNLANAVVRGATTTYTTNGLGERVRKSRSTSSATLFVQDENGNVTGEYNVNGMPFREIIYLENLPVAVLSSGALYYVNPDHLGAPRTITTDAGVPVWIWNHDPFGIGSPLISGKLIYNNRFPGQFYDAETGLYHNNSRDYDPMTGRYIQSDPIGLKGGNNTYVYVGGNPVNAVDPWGLDDYRTSFIPTTWSDYNYRTYRDPTVNSTFQPITPITKNDVINLLDKTATSTGFAGGLAAFAPPPFDLAAIPLEGISTCASGVSYLLKPTPMQTTLDSFVDYGTHLLPAPLKYPAVIINTYSKMVIDRYSN